MVQNRLCEFLRLSVRQVLAQPACVKASLVHADKSDGGKMVVERTEIAFCIRIESFVKQSADNGTLYMQRTCGNVHKLVKPLIELLLVCGKVSETRHVQRNNADAAGAFAASEKSAALFAQLAQIKAQTAAHGADIAGLHVAVDIVGEIRCAVFCRHFEQKPVVFGGGPIEILSDGISRNRVLEAPAVRIAVYHDLDEGLVDHVHFFFAVTVGKIHGFAADDCRTVAQILRNGPIKGDIGERCLSAPAGRGVHTVNKAFDALFDLFIGQIIRADKRCKVCVE